MKRRYKVMPLPLCFQGTGEIRQKMRDRTLEGRAAVPHVFNRPGWYLDRQTGKTWLEFEDRAVEYQNREAFQYDLEQSPGERWMDEHVFQALKIVLDAGLGDEKLRRLFKVEADRRLLHRGRINARPYRLAAIRRFEAFKRKIETR